MSADGYGLSSTEHASEIPAPILKYRPPQPQHPGNHKIGLIGCGGITAYHLAAYRRMGLEVAAMADVNRAAAEARRDEFYPEAAVYDDYRAVLEHPGVTVIDAATHPEPRLGILRDAIAARKHVLSQKPFVTNLTEGEALVAAAHSAGVQLAVNHNGRWAPHLAWMRAAVASGTLGRLASLECSLQWDHTWIASTPFNDVHDLILYDFAIHWFDFTACCFAGRAPAQVTARNACFPDQTMKPPMLAHVLIEYADGGQATLSFNGHVRHGQQDATTLCGTEATVRSTGPSLSEQTVSLHTEAGTARPKLDGTWFESGFEGTMAELLCAIEDDREPANSAASSLEGLALCFAAIESAREDGMGIAPQRHRGHGEEKKNSLGQD
ncbi:MAG: gfo/Idh/MocA family oxidoreductase [Candidatus Hydrogenedens sp.]|nr:gfo/Idh/MocA family oxidoreductase [Candidatus Hydrogenedens sp.]